MLAGLGGLVGGSWVHQVHRASLPLLGFGWASLAVAHGWNGLRHGGGGLLAFSWASLLFAHYWNRFRHGGGALPWVLGILWSSTWVLVANSAIFAVSRSAGGGAWSHLGLDWKPLLQQGLTGTYLALLAADAALAAGWWRFDLSGTAARVAGLRSRQMTRALGQLLNLALGVGLAVAVGVVVINLG